MALALTVDERAMMDGRDGPAVALALRVLCELGRLAGADRLIPVSSAHVDGCRYEGDSGVAFAERFHRAHPHVPVVLITADWMRRLDEHLADHAYLHLWHKPFEYDTLHAALRDWAAASTGQHPTDASPVSAA